MPRLLIACVAVLGIDLVAAPPASACRCLLPAGACDAYGRSALVFTGRVTSTDGSLPVRGTPEGRIEFAVDEAFRGVTGATIAIANLRGNCAVQFKVGETYFVYAYQENAAATPWTSMCSRTVPLARAREDLAYARAMAAVPAGTPALLKGSVRRLDPRPGRGALAGFPVAGATVVATGPAGSFRAVSGKSGEFVIPKLPPGRYMVRITGLPKGLTRGQPVQVDAWDPNACGKTVLWVRARARHSAAM